MKAQNLRWIFSGDEMGPSSSRSCPRALKHSAVILLTLSMSMSAFLFDLFDLFGLRPLAARARHGQELDLHLRRIERRWEEDPELPLFQHLAPEVVLDRKAEVGDARTHRDLRGGPVGHL